MNSGENAGWAYRKAQERLKELPSNDAYPECTWDLTAELVGDDGENQK